MLSVSKVKNSKGASHYFEKDDYYAKDDPNHQKLSSWYGKGAELLGLNGQINIKQFQKILEGKLPNKQQIGLFKDGKIVHDAGRDLTFSAPKSVSIMALVCGDKRLIDAHNIAVKATLDEIERNYIKTRIKQSGITEAINTDVLIAATFQHHTSRNLDPQLHTHCVIANATKDISSDKWRSVFFDDIYDNKKFLGAIYRAELAYQINQLGYEIDIKSNDTIFELKNISQELLDKFSTRSQQIREKAGENATQKQLEQATLITRTKKNSKEHESENLKKIWQEKLIDLPTKQKSPHQINIPLSPQQNNHNNNSTSNIANEALNYAIKDLSERKTVFTKQELIITALNDKLSQIKLSDITTKIDELISKKELLISKNQKLKNTLTTTNLLKKELEIISLMKAGSNQHQPIIKSNINKYSDLLTNLNDGQKQSAKLILTTKDRVVGIQGYAGVGKTFMLKTVNDIATKQHYNFIGLSPTGVATRNLEKEARIASMTLQKFLTKYDGVVGGRGTNKGREIMRQDFKNKAVIVDEASMISTTQMQHLLTISKELNFKVILVGDKQQLDAVEAGTPFYEMQQKGLKTAQMAEIIRQNNPHLKSAVYDVINNDITKSFEKISCDIKETKDVVNTAVAEFMKLPEEQRKSTLILAPANEDRQQINHKISHLLHNSRRGNNIAAQTIYDNTNLTENQKTKSYYFKTGNVLLFGKDRDYLDIKKNDYCQITNINQKTNEITIKNERTDKIAIFNPLEIKGKSEKIYFEVFKTQDRIFKEGDKVAFTRSLPELKIINSDNATITTINNNEISLELNNGKKITINKNSNEIKHLDYSYAVTTHKAQGLTCDTVIAIAESWRKNLTTQKNFYVEISRAREKAIIITDDKTKTIDQLQKNTGVNVSAKEHQNIIINSAKEHNLDREQAIIATNKHEAKAVSPKLGHHHKNHQLNDFNDLHKSAEISEMKRQIAGNRTNETQHHNNINNQSEKQPNQQQNVQNGVVKQRDRGMDFGR